MLFPFLSIVILLVDAFPVPSIILTSSPVWGVEGSVIVIAVLLVSSMSFPPAFIDVFVGALCVAHVGEPLASTIACTSLTC